MVTRESELVQKLVLDLLRRIVCATQENVREKRHSAEVDDGAAEKETLPVFGEGRDTGGLVPGKSLVFSALQICLRVLVRKLPRISPKLSGAKTRSQAGTRARPRPGARPGPRPDLQQQPGFEPSQTCPGRLGEVWSLSDSDCELVSSALFVLSELPSLCSPEGSVSVLPTVLYLLLGVLRELVHRPHHLQSPGPAGLVRSCLRSFRAVLSSPMSRQEKSRESWAQLLQSALSSVLLLWENDDPEVDLDRSSLLTALSQFLLCSSEVCSVSLCRLSLDKFICAIDSKDPQVQTVQLWSDSSRRWKDLVLRLRRNGSGSGGSESHRESGPGAEPENRPQLVSLLLRCSSRSYWMRTL
ncbi:hypothetical protein WMY93_034005 [Mugilogobius chulae]|uniref:Neurochondrin n=1 Tax=Mugilogobius chulae TaxID=88201 RepID=A0AAW0MM08_9GOBI